MMDFGEDDISKEGKFVVTQIAALKAGKPLDMKKLAPILASETDCSNTEMVILKLADSAKRKGNKTAKQMADMLRAAFESHVKAIAKKPRQWCSATLRADAMKIVKGDVAFAEPLLAQAMKAKTDVAFLKDLVYLVAGLDKKRAQRMYDSVQEAAKAKPEWVFAMPAHKPARY